MQSMEEILVSEKELEGVDSELIRGNIDTIILKALMNGDKYGYEIINDIERKSGGAYIIKQPTLYACLKRLEEQGFAKSYWGAKSLGGRKKYYTLTDMGREVFVKSKFEWEHSKIVVDMLISDNQMAGFEVAKKEVIEIDNSPNVDKNSDTFFYGVNENSYDTINSEEKTIEQNLYENIEDAKDSMFSQLAKNNQAGLDKIFENNNDANKADETESHNNTIQQEDEQNLNNILDIYSNQKSYAVDMENTDYSPNQSPSQSFNPFSENDYEEELPFDKLTITKPSDQTSDKTTANSPASTQGQTVSIYYHNSSTNIYNNSSEISTSSSTTSSTTSPDIPHSLFTPNIYDGAIEITASPYEHDIAPTPDVIELPPPSIVQTGEDYFSYSQAPNITMSEADIIRRDYRGALEKLVRNNVKHKTTTTVVQSQQDAKLEKLKESQDSLGENMIIRRHTEILKDYNIENYFYKNRLRLFHHGMMFIIMMAQIAVMLLVHRLLAPFGAEFRPLDIWFYSLSVVVSFAVFPLIAVIFAARDYSARKQIKFDFMGSLLYRLIVVACLWGIIFIVNMLLGVLRYDFTQFLATLVLPSILVFNVFISLFLYKGFLNSGRFNVKN